MLNFFYTIVYFFIGVCYRKRLLMARKNMSANCQSTDPQKYLKKIRQEQDIIIYWSFGKKSFKMLSTSVIQTFNCTIIRLTSTCFSVIRDNIREHRKMMVNFKPGEHMRKMFIFSQSHLNLVLLACVAWRLLPTKPPCYAATFCSLQQALGSN